MTKIDIISGFLGAGKTTFIKKLLQEAISGEQVVLIENEFGEIGIDGGFLKDSGIEIREMNSGCICCSLVGDFGKSLAEVLTTYKPDRIIIEPSGVGKLSDVMKAVIDVSADMDVALNSAVTIVDAAMQAGFPNDQLFPKRGMPINFTVNGGARIARGEAGEAAIVTMNGQPANINTPLEPNSDITIEPSTAGDNAVYTIGQLPEYHESVISFVINGQNVVCPKFVEVNGSLEPDSYEIQEGDSIETRNFYTVAQIAEFMDVEIDPDSEILVNNREAGMETLVYENFSIDWTPLSFGVASESENRYNATEGVTDSAEISQEEMTPETSGETKAAESEKKDTVCVVTVNGETVELTGKEDYIFVDVFDRITFDLNAGNGRAIATLVNGTEAEFSQPLNNGDRVEIYWKEK